MKKRIRKQINWKYLLFCFFLSFFVLFLCTKNSPLYEFNTWVDAQSFFTMGRGWLNGLLPYRDLFDHKGPFLYFLYLIAAFFDSSSMFFVFVLEVLSMSVFTYFSGKIMDFFVSEKRKYYLLPIFLTMIVSSVSFEAGGSAEEFCLPLLMVSFYHLLLFFQREELSFKHLFINGLFAGIIAMIKYNLLGFHFVWIATIFFVYFFKKKRKKAFCSIPIFLIGMLLPILVFVFYFYSQGALQKFLDVYITYNVTGYSGKMHVSFFSRIYQIILIALSAVKGNVFLYLFFFLGIAFVWKDSSFFKEKYMKWDYIFLASIFLVGILYGLVFYPYYILPMSIFSILGLLYISNPSLQALQEKSFPIVSGILVLLFLLQSPNLMNPSLTKKHLAQYAFRDIIQKEEHPTLLNYGFLDGGFYMASSVLPNVYYFQQNNGKAREEIKAYQKEAIEKKSVQFVVTREVLDNKDWSWLEENYRLTKSWYQGIGDDIEVFKLWKLKDAS